MLPFDAPASLLSECCVTGGRREVLRVSVHVWGCIINYPTAGIGSQEMVKLERVGGNCKGRFFMCKILRALGSRMLDSIWDFKEKRF